MMSTTTTTTTSLVDVLTLLDVYSQLHETANQHKKNCTWQITKARQNKGRHGALVVAGVLSAEDVREELCASSSVVLLKNDNTTTSNNSSNDTDTDTVPTWFI